MKNKTALTLMLCIGLALASAACSSRNDNSAAEPVPAEEAVSQKEQTHKEQTVEDIFRAQESRIKNRSKNTEEPASDATAEKAEPVEKAE